MSLNENHSRSVRERRWNSNHRQGWDDSLTQESRHPKVGPAHKEVITKFGSHIFPRESEVPRTTLRHSNGLTAGRDERAKGLFPSAKASNLQKDLIPGRRSNNFTGSSLLSSVATADYKSHHPPEPNRTSVPTSKNQPSNSSAPYAWNPSNPESSTYGFHRRW
mmetsp:Transcript_14999/g.19459  ORF Transcript_14999/g.19459 Transcript_14999/m.19459 type:complete len:163 (-) Transcript_14999:202-690(-)